MARWLAPGTVDLIGSSGYVFRKAWQLSTDFLDGRLIHSQVVTDFVNNAGGCSGDRHSLELILWGAPEACTIWGAPKARTIDTTRTTAAANTPNT